MTTYSIIAIDRARDAHMIEDPEFGKRVVKALGRMHDRQTPQQGYFEVLDAQLGPTFDERTTLFVRIENGKLTPLTRAEQLHLERALASFRSA